MPWPTLNPGTWWQDIEVIQAFADACTERHLVAGGIRPLLPGFPWQGFWPGYFVGNFIDEAGSIVPRGMALNAAESTNNGVPFWVMVQQLIDQWVGSGPGGVAWIRTHDDGGDPIDHDGKTVMERWTAAKLGRTIHGAAVASPFRRYRVHPDHGGTPLFGNQQAGDILGPWVFEDTMAALNHLTLYLGSAHIPTGGSPFPLTWDGKRWFSNAGGMPSETAVANVTPSQFAQDDGTWEARHGALRANRPGPFSWFPIGFEAAWYYRSEADGTYNAFDTVLQDGVFRRIATHSDTSVPLSATLQISTRFPDNASVAPPLPGLGRWGWRMKPDVSANDRSFVVLYDFKVPGGFQYV